jgi:TPR repeat protein
MDKKEAARWFFQAARQGHAEAQSNLGWIYARGEGVAVNKAEAARWWKKAAAQGDSLARHNLDVLCRDNPAACK